MSHGQLTDAAIARARPGDVLYDSGRWTGLHLRAMTRRKTFYLYYRDALGAQHRPRIGDAASMSLQEARQKASELLLRVGAGEEVERPSQAKHGRSVQALATRYMAEWAPRKKAGPQRNDRLMWELHILPRLARRPVASITHKDIETLHQRLASKPYMGNRVLSLLSKAFSLAERWGWRKPGTNPCRHVDRHPEQARRRYMTAEEAPRFAAALEGLRRAWPQEVTWVRVVQLTGARESEIRTARREWRTAPHALDLPDSKTGAKRIYLPPEAQVELDALPAAGPCYFPARRGDRGKPMGRPSKFWARLIAEAGMEGFRPHDLRHSFASAALAGGVGLDQVGALLGHADPKTTRRYAHLLDEAGRELSERVSAAIAARGAGGR